MKVVSLFTGCGGLDIGLHQAGHEIILQCECDPGAQQVLRKAFAGVLLVPDICGLERLPKETDLVAAGFPCIDVSRAGLRQGLEGPSTGLVRHVFRLLAQAKSDARPVPWVLLENVEALLDRCHGGPPLVSWVVAQLEALGYRSWAHRVICSAGFGVPNRRKRIFILASMHGDARDVLLGQGLQRCMGSCLGAVGGDCWECFDPDDDPTTGNKSEAAMLRCSYALDLGNARSAAGVDVVPTFTTSNARICLLLSNGRYGALRIEDAERLQGLPTGHTQPCYPVCAPGLKMHRAAAAVKDSDADTAARARFALLGNAVTVQVAQWIGERLSDPYRYKYLVTDNDMPLPREHQPASITDSTWQSLREVRLDQLSGVGAAGGQAKLVSRGQTGWQALQPGASSEEEEEGDSGAEDGEEGDGNEAQPAAAAAAAVGHAAGGSGAGSGGCAAAGDESEGDDDEQQAAAAAAATDDDVDEGPAANSHGCGQSGRALAGQAATKANGKVVRYSTGRLSAGWPRAAWYTAGHGRWGLKEASDTPVKARFAPLGEFIKRVGPAPSDVALVTYLQRLKEQGWNVDRTERKMLMCGVAGLGGGTSGAAAAAGLQDLLADVLNPNGSDTSTAASSIGRLVWAQLDINPHSGASSSSVAAAAGRVLWPCEAIDPFNLPRGFKLLPEHKLALKADERRLYLPDEGRQDKSSSTPSRGAEAANTTHAQQLANGSSEVAAAGAATLSHGSPEVGLDCSNPTGLEAAGCLAGSNTPARSGAAAADGGSKTAVAGEPAARRKVLLVWFHTNQFEWRFDDELLAFESHKARIKSEAQSLMEAGKLPRPQEWRRAYREAKHCNTIVARAAKLRARAAELAGIAGPAAAQMAAAEMSSDGGSSSGSDEEGQEKGHRAAVAGRAAKQALAVNLRMPRCKVCEACTQSTGSTSRRCLLVRATAAAAAGHAGAQLSVLGDKAVGAEVDVWWPLDQAWYKGVVTAYDKLRVRHTITYEDGDVEIIPLWAPQQRVKLRSQPAQWIAKAAELKAEHDKTRREIEEARFRVAGAGGLPEGANPLTVLEQERADNIQRNKEQLQRIMADAPQLDELDPMSAPPTGLPPAATVGGPVTPPPAKSVPTLAKKTTPGAGSGDALHVHKAKLGVIVASKLPFGSATSVRGQMGASSSLGGLMQQAGQASKRPRGRPPKPKTAASTASGSSMAAIAAGATSGVAPSHQPSKSVADKVHEPHADGLDNESGSVAPTPSKPAVVADSQPEQDSCRTSNRGSKRSAAAVAEFKIKDQMTMLQAVKVPPIKKKKAGSNKVLGSQSELAMGGAATVAGVDADVAAAAVVGEDAS